MKTYEPYKHGQITKLEANTIYRAKKEGKIDVLPETTKLLYDCTNSYIRYASERYTQDFLFYDRIYKATEAILCGNYNEAQENLNDWQNDLIARAGKKSVWKKYQ